MVVGEILYLWKKLSIYIRFIVSVHANPFPFQLTFLRMQQETNFLNCAHAEGNNFFTRCTWKGNMIFRC
jgi:hypothetical protein